MSTTHFSGPVAVGAGKIKSVTASITLTANDNGSVLILDAAAPGTITLPPVTVIGFECKVINGASLTSNAVLASAAGDDMEGALMVASTVVTVAAADQINFVNTAENVGDWVSVISDGSLWFVDGRALTTGGLTATG